MRARNPWEAQTQQESPCSFHVLLSLPWGAPEGNWPPSRRLKGTLSEERVLMSEGGAGGQTATRQAVSVADLGGGGEES